MGNVQMMHKCFRLPDALVLVYHATLSGSLFSARTFTSEIRGHSQSHYFAKLVMSSR